MNDKICTLVFLRRNDQILLAMKKRGFGSDRYNGIGGKIEPNETVEDAMIRETQEEIGVTPLIFHKVAEHVFTCDAKTNPWRMYVHAFICTQWEGEPVETDEMAPEWFNLCDIPYDNMWQDDRYWVPQVLEGTLIQGEFTFDEQDNMLTHDITEVADFLTPTA